MAQSSIHHRQNALWRGLWMLFSCDWTIACTSGKSRPLRNEAWSSDPPKWYIDTLFFTWSAMTGLLECGILYFSTYSKLCKTQYTHITHMQHDIVLFVLNNACLRPRNTGIIAMSWPQKITSSSSELIKLVQLCQLECTAVCNPSGKIFNCFRACDKVSAERWRWSGDTSSDPRGSQFGLSMVTLYLISLHHSKSSFLQPIENILEVLTFPSWSDWCWQKFLCS